MMHKTDGHNREHLVIQHCVQQCPRTVGFQAVRSSDHGEGCNPQKLSGTASISLTANFWLFSSDMDASSAVKDAFFRRQGPDTVVDDGKNDKVRGMDSPSTTAASSSRTQKLLFDILRDGDKGVKRQGPGFFLQIQDNGWGQAGSH